jgi:opacity protein-like surface antigen
MKFTKILGVAAAAALALMAFASTASATTLEKEGVAQTGAITISASLKKETSALLTDTSGFLANTCTVSTVEGSDSTKTTGTAVEGPISVLSWGTTTTPCTEGNPTVDTKGSLSVERIGTTTNGTVKSKNAKVTVPSPFGLLTCTTPAEGTDIGTLTGVKTGNATMDISAVLNCGITAKWSGTYVVTSPVGLGVTS